MARRNQLAGCGSGGTREWRAIPHFQRASTRGLQPVRSNSDTPLNVTHQRTRNCRGHLGGPGGAFFSNLRSRYSIRNKASGLKRWARNQLACITKRCRAGALQGQRISLTRVRRPWASTSVRVPR